MHTVLKKTGRAAARFLLSALALGLILLAIIQILLVAGFAWLNTGKGREIVEAQLNKATGADNFTIGSLFYDPVRGVNLYDFSWRDNDGELFSANRISVGIAFEKIFIRQLDLVVTGQGLSLRRLPESAPEDENETAGGMKPFALPDIFFNRVTISGFAIDDIMIGEKIAGQTIYLSPRLRGDVSIDKAVTFDLALRPHITFENPPPAPMPEEIAVSGNFSSDELEFILQNFSIRSADYSLSAKGEGSFLPDGRINFLIEGEYPDLTPLTQGNFKSFRFTAGANGLNTAPAFTLDGKLESGLLADKGLQDITLHAVPDLSKDVPEAITEIRTAYKDDPITLSAILSYASPLISLKNISGEAPALSLAGDISFDTGTGMGDGSLQIIAEDFSHYKDLIGQELAGKLKADIALKPLEAQQSVSANIDISSLKYGSISAQKITADAFVENIEHPWPKDADLNVSKLTLSPDITIATAAAAIKANDDLSYKLSLSGKGNMPQGFSFKGSSTLSEFEGAFPSARDIAFDVLAGRSNVKFSGSITPDTVDLKAGTKGLRITALPVSLPEGLSALTATGEITMAGSTSAPKTDIDLSFSGLQTGKYQGLSIRTQGHHESDVFSLSVSGKGTGIRTLDAAAKVPLSFSLQPFNFAFDKDAVLQGGVKADIDIAPIAGLFLSPVQEFSGRMDANADLSGTVSNPFIKGTSSIRGGAFRDGINGIEIADIEVRSAFDNDAISISSLSATDGESGTIKGSGMIAFTGNRSNFNAEINNFHAPKEGIADAHFDADLSLNDAQSGYSLGGNINITDMNVTIPERFQSGIPELNIVERNNDNAQNPTRSVFLDVGISAKNQIFVRGWGLDAEFGGDLKVTGTAQAPLVNGAFKSIRGRYEEFGKRFELDKAELRFQGEIPPSPYLDIEASTDAEDVTAKILFSGPMKAPSLKFSSVPELPEDEVLSRILFGKTTSNISPFQAVQLAQTLRRFSGEGGGGIDPLGMLRSVTGLDDIRVDTNDEGETSVGAGKYLTDNVYLEFEKGKAENSGAANLQIELTPSINVETKLGQDAQGGGGIFWKHDY
ncbi:MAG: hypothetical protein DI626_00465 [Micavibrio aeruginosavorus]|uniref:Translocation and assembly module TamB C-terminal domain-containing protein n=1 Tax=Micavibrio aeruginosavorus TaxID=349221 RepID=A0A2W5A6U0_9BACT|nr:MAG: hypothetical protein DI626_00465 [Micavibrio aeruginosavorus]